MTQKQFIIKKRQEAQVPIINATQSKQSPKFDNTPSSNKNVDHNTFKKTDEEKAKLKELKKAAPKSFSGKHIVQF